MVSLQPRVELAAGGFAPDTSIVTTEGLKSVQELERGDVVYALNGSTGIAKPKRIGAVEAIRCDDPLIAVETNRASLLVHPNQRIPYRTKAVSDIRFQSAGELSAQRHYKFINEWTFPSKPARDIIDVTDLISEYEIRAWSEKHGHTFRAELPDGCTPTRSNSHTGYYFDAETFKQHQDELETQADELSIVGGPNQRGRPYRFDGDDFVQFLGWFITEGSVTWSTNRNTGEVKIAQQYSAHRDSIRNLLDRMGFDIEETERTFRFGSELYARLFEDLCGRASADRRLPALVWSLSRAQQELLFETLLAGDGTDRGTYYTTSDRLAADLCRLAIVLGLKPRYTRRGELWELFFNHTNDGFDSQTHLTRGHAASVYRLTVKDYSVVMAGRDGRFQWCGVSHVC